MTSEELDYSRGNRIGKRTTFHCSQVDNVFKRNGKTEISAYNEGLTALPLRATSALEMLGLTQLLVLRRHLEGREGRYGSESFNLPFKAKRPSEDPKASGHR
jgi:hypothetical protein